MKRFIAILAVMVSLATLGGCSLMDSNIGNLLKTPRPNKVQTRLRSAIDGALGSKIKYLSPSSGTYRTSLLQVDLNQTGSKETVLFFFPSADAEVAQVALFEEKEDGSWGLTKQIQGASNAIDYVEFADCNADGNLDILVGWIRGDSARELFVYDLFAAGEGVLYTDGYNESRFFTDNGAPLVFSASFDKAQGVGLAKLVTLDENGFLAPALTCPIDAHFQAVNNISYARISSERRAFIFDAKNDNNATTQLLFYDGKTLTNPYYGEELHSAFVRETSLISQDIDKDGIIEFPASDMMPFSSLVTLSPATLTSWSAHNPASLSSGEEAPLLYEFSCILNSPLGYYYIYPAEWQGRVAVYMASDRSLVYYHIDSNTGESTLLFTIARLSVDEYTKRINTGTWYQLYRDGDRVYAIDFAQNLSPALKLLVGTVDDNRARLILY